MFLNKTALQGGLETDEPLYGYETPFIAILSLSDPARRLTPSISPFEIEFDILDDNDYCELDPQYPGRVYIKEKGLYHISSTLSATRATSAESGVLSSYIAVNDDKVFGYNMVTVHPISFGEAPKEVVLNFGEYIYLEPGQFISLYVYNMSVSNDFFIDLSTQIYRSNLSIQYIR